ncbi:arginine--tRNA ligase [Thioflexithrix psekupsensis]|uniref:Arginine--tRNA ligase n=1 Tax=Thioflexithrix psekupsensis TaxID=1570016 RepID=A0A251X9H1_9GAMM|nr:arginine--tRNA ligase [Thioflexithrix psekupsensis]OUD14656.1 arginine--tRNA ligase [Thioflexithrix psekupsensis]
MKQQFAALFEQAFIALQTEGVIPSHLTPAIQLDRTRDSAHGDFACNIALILAKPCGIKPRDLAVKFVEKLSSAPDLQRVEVAGPGFINLFLHPQAYQKTVKTILMQADQYGCGAKGSKDSVLVEFVSANPTGPLHVGHGRGAAYGSTLANLLMAAGHSVFCEYYVNDAGRQMDILAVSVWLRYLELCGESFVFPSNGYKGDYIFDIAADVHREHKDRFRVAAALVFADVTPDATQENGDKEQHIDDLIRNSKRLLGLESFRIVFNAGLQVILEDIRQDLTQFGVTYDRWFSELSLYDGQPSDVDQAIAQLIKTGHTYEQEGALWFRSTTFGDEKDRVLVRENGQKTYFASDVAYHWNKLGRGFSRLVNIWGADHHGYIARVKAAIQALGGDPTRLSIQLVQFATLYRGTERLQMSTRSGEFVTLRELRQEVGKDATRFFYVQRRSEQHLDFDLELAKSHSTDNPVYYIQYAHARIHSVLKQLADRDLTWQFDDKTDWALLNNAHEMSLLHTLARYPEVIEVAAANYEPHQVVYYLRELAQAFHTYYNEHKFIVEDVALRQARLSVVMAVRQVLQNGLAILGVSAPEVM